MKTIYLHIGFHKTGSTAIQSAMSKVDNEFIVYAKLGYENHSIPIYTAFSEKYETYHVWKSRGESRSSLEKRRKAYRERLVKFISENKNRNIIISGEDIRALSIAGLEDLKNSLSVGQHQIKVLAYVREPLSFMRSVLQENIKNGHNPTAPSPTNYRSSIDKFWRVFGVESVRIRSYDKDRLKNNDVISDFCDLIGLDEITTPAHANISLSTKAVQVLYHINSKKEFKNCFRSGDWSRAALIGHLRNLLPGPFILPDHLISALVKNSDIQWLFRNTGIDYREKMISKDAQFDPAALADFLAEVDDDTLGVLRRDLRQNYPRLAQPDDLHAFLKLYAQKMGRVSRGTWFRAVLSRLAALFRFKPG